LTKYPIKSIHILTRYIFLGSELVSIRCKSASRSTE